MKAILASEMRELDRKAIEEVGVPGVELMERAGYGVAEYVRSLAHTAGLGDSLIQIFAGRGNNGGDAFVAARYLNQMEFRVEVLFAGEASSVSGDALQHMNQMLDDGVVFRELPMLAEWELLQAFPEAAGDILVDGLLGTGISGPARGPVAGAIQTINAFSERSLVIAIDVPSGLDSDTGESEGDAVEADFTVTMGLPKRGLVMPCARDLVGVVTVIDIGIPREFTEPLESPVELITIEDIVPLVKKRQSTSHKGTYGHVLLIGGAPGYAGAIAMAAMSAIRSGVGLVTVLVPESVLSIVAGLVPEAMVHGGNVNDRGSLAADALEHWGRDLDEFDAVLLGPGMSAHADTSVLVGKVLAASSAPVVLDADALNVIAADPELIDKKNGPVVLTPHPGEMARLMECDSSEIEDDRFGAATKAVDRFGATIVLKGAGTIVAEKGRALQVNMTGNPGMATGGMGDVLSGLMAGMIARGMSAFDAARTSVFIHGRTGDIVAQLSSQSGMVATDIIRELPQTLRLIER